MNNDVVYLSSVRLPPRIGMLISTPIESVWAENMTRRSRGRFQLRYSDIFYTQSSLTDLGLTYRNISTLLRETSDIETQNNLLRCRSEVVELGNRIVEITNNIGNLLEEEYMKPTLNDIAGSRLNSTEKILFFNQVIEGTLTVATWIPENHNEGGSTSKA